MTQSLQSPETVSTELQRQLDRCADRVRAAAARYRLAASDVDEVFQEVRIRLWRALEGNGKIAEAPASYVYRTAVSAAVDLIRRRRARREEQFDLSHPGREAIAGVAPAADRETEHGELAEMVNEEISRLPDDQALAVRMHLSGYGRDEIATLLRWSEPRTRHLIYRGLERLRARLEARGVR